MRSLRHFHSGLVTLMATLPLIGCVTQTPSKKVSQPSGTQSSGVQPSSTQSSGVVQNVRQAVKRAADREDLKNFGLAYFQYASLNGRGPGSVEDIKDSLPAKMIDALQDDSVYVVVWSVRNPSSETIVAYAAQPDSYGRRLVGRGDGSVVLMNQEEFERVKPRR